LLCGHRSEDEIIFAQRIARLAAEFAPRLVSGTRSTPR